MDCSVFTTDQRVGLALTLEIHVDRIARGAGHVERNHALLADERVDQRRLADVRTAHDGDLDAARSLFLVALFRLPRVCDFQRIVDHLGHAVAVRRRNGARIAEPELVEVRGDRAVLHPLGLVDDEENRPANLAQIVGNRLVLRRETIAAVNNEHDDVRFFNCLTGLARHLMEDAVFGDRFETAGVHHEVRALAGAAFAVVAIACETRQVGNERITRARETVE
jgi:hypothetical protein